MSTTTTNYGLVKPELTDAADITAMNPNWDKIDQELNKKYGTDNKPTASDVGALPNNEPVPINKGGTGATTAKEALSNLGTLPIDGSKPMTSELKIVNGLAKFGANEGLAVINKYRDPANPANIYRSIKLIDGSVSDIPHMVRAVDKEGEAEKEYTLYGEHNLELIKQYFLPLDGSVPMSGNTLGFNSFQQSVYGSYNTVSLRNWKSTNDINKNGYDLSLYRNLGANNALYLQEYVDGKATSYRIFGEHNKPSGTYTGNGSATSRMIEIGGIGNAVIVICTANSTALIITASGAFGKTGGSTGYFSYDTVHFTNGIITIASTDGSLNASGKNYTYQVL